MPWTMTTVRNRVVHWMNDWLSDLLTDWVSECVSEGEWHNWFTLNWNSYRSEKTWIWLRDTPICRQFLQIVYPKEVEVLTNTLTLLGVNWQLLNMLSKYKFNTLLLVSASTIDNILPRLRQFHVLLSMKCANQVLLCNCKKIKKK